jgi:hypothetical protein
VDPKYPKDARKQKRQGAVVLHVKIGEDGQVQDLSVVSGDPRLRSGSYPSGQEVALSTIFGGREADRGGTEGHYKLQA